MSRPELFHCGFGQVVRLDGFGRVILLIHSFHGFAGSVVTEDQSAGLLQGLFHRVGVSIVEIFLSKLHFTGRYHLHMVVAEHNRSFGLLPVHRPYVSLSLRLGEVLRMTCRRTGSRTGTPEPLGMWSSFPYVLHLSGS